MVAIVVVFIVVVFVIAVLSLIGKLTGGAWVADGGGCGGGGNS